MANRSGGFSLWDATAIEQDDKSANAFVGNPPNVAIYVSVESGGGDVTFKFQVSGTVGPTAGRNAADDAQVDGDSGLIWFDYYADDGTLIEFTVPDGENQCFELAPFSPPYLRLVRTDANAASTVTAFVTATGET